MKLLKDHRLHCQRDEPREKGGKRAGIAGQLERGLQRLDGLPVSAGGSLVLRAKAEQFRGSSDVLQVGIQFKVEPRFRIEAKIRPVTPGTLDEARTDRLQASDDFRAPVKFRLSRPAPRVQCRKIGSGQRPEAVAGSAVVDPGIPGRRRPEETRAGWIGKPARELRESGVELGAEGPPSDRADERAEDGQEDRDGTAGRDQENHPGAPPANRWLRAQSARRPG